MCRSPSHSYSVGRVEFKVEYWRQTRDAAINVQFSQNYKNVSKHFICAFNFVASCELRVARCEFRVAFCLCKRNRINLWQFLHSAGFFVSFRFFYFHFISAASFDFFSFCLLLLSFGACCSDKNLNNSPNVPS